MPQAARRRRLVGREGARLLTQDCGDTMDFSEEPTRRAMIELFRIRATKASILRIRSA